MIWHRAKNVGASQGRAALNGRQEYPDAFTTYANTDVPVGWEEEDFVWPDEPVPATREPIDYTSPFHPWADLEKPAWLQAIFRARVARRNDPSSMAAGSTAAPRAPWAYRGFRDLAWVDAARAKARQMRDETAKKLSGQQVDADAFKKAVMPWGEEGPVEWADAKLRLAKEARDAAEKKVVVWEHGLNRLRYRNVLDKLVAHVKMARHVLGLPDLSVSETEEEVLPTLPDEAGTVEEPSQAVPDVADTTEEPVWTTVVRRRKRRAPR